MRLLDKQKAVKLRKSGYTYNEIRQAIPNLSKGTLSGWVKQIRLSEEQKDCIYRRVKTRVDKARIKGAWANRIKWQNRIDKITYEAMNDFKKFRKNPLFLVGLSLYWAEGSRKNRRFQFINSDQDIIRIMVRWLREIFNIQNDQITVRLYIHQIYKEENCEVFWAKILGIPVKEFSKTIYKPTPHFIKKNLTYKGCCRIEVRGSELFWKVQAWQKLILKI